MQKQCSRCGNMFNSKSSSPLCLLCREKSRKKFEVGKFYCPNCGSNELEASHILNNAIVRARCKKCGKNWRVNNLYDEEQRAKLINQP